MPRNGRFAPAKSGRSRVISCESQIAYMALSAAASAWTITVGRRITSRPCTVRPGPIRATTPTSDV